MPDPTMAFKMYAASQIEQITDEAEKKRVIYLNNILNWIQWLTIMPIMFAFLGMLLLAWITELLGLGLPDAYASIYPYVMLTFCYVASLLIIKLCFNYLRQNMVNKLKRKLGCDCHYAEAMKRLGEIDSTMVKGVNKLILRAA